MERTSNDDNFRRRIFISKSDLTQFPHNGVITANIVLFTLKFMNKQTSSETGFPLVSQKYIRPCGRLFIQRVLLKFNFSLLLKRLCGVDMLYRQLHTLGMFVVFCLLY